MSEAKTITDKEVPRLPWELFPKEGDSFAGYTLGETIGKGSFGTVFKVQSDPDVEWFEAVKILHRSGDIDKQRFLEEISRLKEIKTPGMARIHAAGECDDHLYYCMDYIEGETIDDYIEAGNQNKLYSLFIELCDTVQKLHELNFVHLDIKPHNVMVNEEGQIRLLDLGISRKTGEASDISAEGFGAGTYEFAPSEQIDGKAPENSMDVYALGCLLYTLLSSSHPKIPFDSLKREKPYGKFYSKPGLERSDLLTYCLSEDVKNIAEHDILINEKTAAIIMRSLAGRDERYKSVKEFKDALIKSGVLLDSFIIAYEGMADDEILSRVSNTVSEISLEFASQLQIFFKEKKELTGFEVDLLLSSEKSAEHDSFVITTREDVNEKLVSKLRDLVFDKVNESDDQEAWEESPYKSLNSYTEEEADLFFGRDDEVIDIFSQINSIPKESGLLAVLAPSGAGKSSFLQAGLIPHFKKQQWSTCFSLPGYGGFERLSTVVKSFLQENSSKKKLIIIDQFEELLHDSESSRFIASNLKSWAGLDDSIVIVSLRNDFYKEYISFLDVNKLPDNFYNLPQPDESNLAKMIKMPALKAHLTFEKDPRTGKGLDEVLREEALLNPESLAALSFTLDEIFTKSPRGRLSYKVYSDLGGMHGAMAKRAESLFRSLKLKRASFVFHHVFHQLIQVDENRIPRRLHAEYEKLTSDEESKCLTDEFIKAKLFQVTSEESTNRRVVTVSHEALIQQNRENGWRRVMQWLNRQRDNLLVRKRLAVAVSDWEENKRQSRFLYSSYSRLKEILILRDSGWSLTDSENQFIKKSYRAILRAAVLILVSLVALVWISISLWRETNNVSNLTKNINDKKEEVDQLTEAANKLHKDIESLNVEKSRAKSQLEIMDDYNRLSLISSLQQSGALPPSTAVSLLSEVSEKSRNWLWGQLLYKSLPNYLMLFGHTEEVLSVEFSPDKEGSYLLTSSWDNRVILWNGKNGEKIKDLPWQPKVETWDFKPFDFEDAAFSYDGYAVAANNDGRIYIWNIEEAVKTNVVAQGYDMPHGKIRKLFFSKDNKFMLCAGSDGKFSIWDWAGKNFNKPLAVAVHTDTKEKDLMRVYGAQLSPDGKTVMSAGWDGNIKKWSWDGASLAEEGLLGKHDAQIWSGTFSSDGSTYLSAGRDRVAKLWDVETSSLMNEYGSVQGEGEHKSDVRSAVFSPDGQMVLTASRDKKIRFWEMESGDLVKEKQIHDNIVYDVTFSADSSRFATVSADKLVNLCYLENFLNESSRNKSDMLHDEPVEHFDVVGDTLASAVSGGTVRLWDLYQGTLRSYFDHTPPKGEFLIKSYLLSKSRVISADSSGGIFVWQAEGDEWRKVLEISKPLVGKLNDLAISKNKDYLTAAFADGLVIVWDIASGKPVYSNHFDLKNPVIAFSENAEVVGFGEENGSVLIVDWRKKEVVDKFHPHKRKVFDLKIVKFENEEFVVTSSRDGSVIISDFKGNKIKSVSHGVRGDAAYAAVSSDGLFMATASARDNNVFFWDLQNEIELLPLSGHEEPISMVEFFDDMIISASRDGTIRKWYSISWEQLEKKVDSGDTELTSQEKLQKAVRTYLYGWRDK